MEIISIANKTDANEILWLQYTAYRSEAEIYNDFTIQPLTQTLEQVSAELDGGIVLKAVADGKIVDSVCAYEKNNIAYINNLIILPSYQNKDISRRLLKQ